MNRATDFSRRLTDFLSKFLPGEKGFSANTIASYKDTFILFLTFMKEIHDIPAERLTLDQISRPIVTAYLEWLEKERCCSTASRNVRLAALHSFFRYLQYSCPENMAEGQAILSIPIKKTEKPVINYLTLDGIRLLLEQPDQSTQRGRRDLAMLSLLYDSAARVSEIIDLTPSMLRLDTPCTVKLVGKGKKARIVPLLDDQVRILKVYMQEQRLLFPHANMYPLFFNSRREKLTRAGMNYILAKYADKAREKKPAIIPNKLSCHCLRHSKSMHLLQSGVNLVYIRDILGHSSILVTEMYAKTDSRQKREAIANAYESTSPSVEPSWTENSDLLAWLKSFGRQ